jgi:hypothetical protein
VSVNANRSVRVAIAGIACLVLAAAAALLAGGRAPWHVDADPAAQVFLPVPLYQVEAVSGSHTARLLNLPLPVVGLPQIPTPVDVNGDLLPDVTVSVNLINAEGLLRSPLSLGRVIAPNIEINRLVSAPVLTPGADPLRINVVLRVADIGPARDSLALRYGYDTGPGGSIPPSYKAVLGGVENLFNPLVATIDTTGGLLNAIDPGLPDLGLAAMSSAYEGPLTTFASLDSMSLDLAADLRFEPMPDRLDATLATDPNGETHVTVAHTGGETDLEFGVDVAMADLLIDANGRLDRVSRHAAIDLRGELLDGGVDVALSGFTGRAPDLRVDGVVTVDGLVIDAAMRMEGIPATLSADWRFPEAEVEGALPAPEAAKVLPKLVFEAGGDGIGAIDADVTMRPVPSAQLPQQAIPPRFVPETRQYLSAVVKPVVIAARARIEQLRSASFEVMPDGAIVASVDAGDGTSPIQVDADLDLRLLGLPYIDATATVAPLPSDMDVVLRMPSGTGAAATPFEIEYDGSASPDIDATALIGLFDPTLETTPTTNLGVYLVPAPPDFECGDAAVVCADLALSHVPTSMDARFLSSGPNVDLAIDTGPSEAGSPPLDVVAHALLVPPPGLGLPPALQGAVVADVELLGLPDGFRLEGRFGEDGLGIDGFACQPDGAGGCDPGAGGRIADARFSLHSFPDDVRPADFPSPGEPARTFLTTTIRPTRLIGSTPTSSRRPTSREPAPAPQPKRCAPAAVW